MSFEAFRAEIGRLADVLCAVNLLQWDTRTMMPPGGVEGRAHQLATLTSLAREIATGPALKSAIERARDTLAGGGSDAERDEVEFAAGAIATLERISSRLVSEAAELKTRANAAWIEARREDDFAGFAPFLQRTVELQRDIAAAIGSEGHPYDALIGTYEPCMTLSRLRPLLDELRTELAPLLAKARDLNSGVDLAMKRFPVERQKLFAKELAGRLGYDFARGRLDDTVHPFEISMTRGDVRITGRFREEWLPAGMFGVWHEVGHGLYEQGIAPELTRSAFAIDFVNLYAVGGTSFGMHESQSRLIENRVGRSRRFWELHFGRLRDAFPDELAGVSEAGFWRAVNAARPGPIRVEADELTYDLHIMLRVEIEAALIAGEIEVRDLPGLWRERMRDLLGIEVSTDREGVLQDVHWSSGMIGSFATYTLGNVMGAQLFEAATRDRAVSAGIDGGDYGPLRDWLGHHIHRHGRRFPAEALLERATGEALSTRSYLAALRAKVDGLAA
ncbi:carboxypeptidase M32 [Aureimonas leprariae]|uniref:Metal-dependent carboxypeptidase n=1 Tax=Plantimonas leprariae TaxID=2615207 RepID=A0A7V7PL16_9HYPH|nr:carboxypeptidase M32 [Aureimonas leprariae]KAB0676819.1 carboxypeptidase M32 [Aureimonas leprariae]